MTHSMQLNPAPFEKIKSGAKTIELRLNDEKRRRIKTGDKIEFDMNLYYTPERQAKYGALGIEIRVKNGL